MKMSPITKELDEYSMSFSLMKIAITHENTHTHTHLYQPPQKKKAFKQGMKSTTKYHCLQLSVYPVIYICSCLNLQGWVQFPADKSKRLCEDEYPRCCTHDDRELEQN